VPFEVLTVGHLEPCCSDLQSAARGSCQCTSSPALLSVSPFSLTSSSSAQQLHAPPQLKAAPARITQTQPTLHARIPAEAASLSPRRLPPSAGAGTMFRLGCPKCRSLPRLKFYQFRGARRCAITAATWPDAADTQARPSSPLPLAAVDTVAVRPEPHRAASTITPRALSLEPNLLPLVSTAPSFLSSVSAIQSLLPARAVSELEPPSVSFEVLTAGHLEPCCSDLQSTRAVFSGEPPPTPRGYQTPRCGQLTGMRAPRCTAKSDAASQPLLALLLY
jgi:hypothetical protein